MTSNTIIRFSDVATQPEDLSHGYSSPVRRIIGFVEARYLLPLFYREALRPNPRSARRNPVTAEILSSLQEAPEMFHFRSKGVLLGTSTFDSLQRRRFRLEFADPSVEGILDGGHNMLSIGLHLLQPVMGERDWKRIKSWDELMEVWEEYYDTVSAQSDRLDFLVPLELLVPTDEEDTDEFMTALVDICRARNNNAQLPQEAAMNKRGLFEPIAEEMPDEISRRVEWRPNTWEDEDESRPIKVRDLVALSWIPLNLLNESGELPIDVSVTPQNIYRNKGECSKQFEKLMMHPLVTEKGDGGVHSLVHKGVRSAFKVLSDLPRLYDQIYEDFPDAYNSGTKRFRANPIVKLYDPAGRKLAKAEGKDTKVYITSHPVTPFLRREVTAKGSSNPCSYPDGLIIPLIYGLQGLMEVVDGEVRWGVDDPYEFVRRNLPAIARNYQVVLEMSGRNWDPQRIAKNPGSHSFAVQQFQTVRQLTN